ncbi:hypothetical protein LCGC14_0538510 [marine sediment metagenome]|uniref:Uncharacterized protein n=1 Tax=marine sediment metagenome TaxID=412755 RepID=A0A0F9UEX7_9ZZZZ
MTASAGAVSTTVDKRSGTQNNFQVWERVTVFTLVSGNTTGAATLPINGLLQKIIVKLTDMQGAEGTLDVSLTDNGDNTIFSVTNLAESATYQYSVNEPFSHEINIALVFDNPGAGATVTVTLRGI